MSIDAILWALKQELPGLQRVVLIELANFADNDTYDCYPFIDQLTAKCGVSDKTVRRSINQLIERQLIAKKSGAGRGSTRYKLAVNRAELLSEWLDSDQCSPVSRTSNGCSAVCETGQDDRTRSVVRSVRPVSAVCETALYNQSLNQSLKKINKKALSKNAAVELCPSLQDRSIQIPENWDQKCVEGRAGIAATKAFMQKLSECKSITDQNITDDQNVSTSTQQAKTTLNAPTYQADDDFKNLQNSVVVEAKNPWDSDYVDDKPWMH